jgi:methionyl aminopeptidase
MREAGRINLLAIETAIRCTTGRHPTLKELDIIIEDVILRNNCQPAFKGYRDYPATSCISVNDVAVHGIPNDYRIDYGDLVTIDVGTRCHDWCVDAARTFVVPQVFNHEKLQDQWNQRCTLASAAEAILFAELDTIRDGVSLWDIANAGEKEAKRQGVDLICQYGGHQIGESIHIDPFIPNSLDRSKGEFFASLQKRKLKSYCLKEGQTVCLEPVVTIGCTNTYIDEDGWTVRTQSRNDVAHTERCILILSGGYEILT